MLNKNFAKPYGLSAVPYDGLTANDLREMLKQTEPWSAAPGVDRDDASRILRDPNFRQLVRVQSHIQGAGRNNIDDGSPNSSAAPSAFAPKQERPVPVLAGLGKLGRALPPPVPPDVVRRIPVPPIPETWKNAGTLLRVLPEMARGLATGNRLGLDELGGDATALAREKQEAGSQERNLSQNEIHQPGQQNDPKLPGGLIGLRLRSLQAARQQQQSSQDGDAIGDRVIEPPDDFPDVSDAFLQAKQKKNFEKILEAKKERERLQKERSYGNYPSSGGGGRNGSGSRSGGDEGDFCRRRFYEERNECNQRYSDGEFAVLDHYRGCKERARQRWNACNQGEQELARWNPAVDEEIGIRQDR